MRRYRRRLKSSRPSAQTIAKQQCRTEREEALAAATVRAADQLGSKLYGVLCVDPPWRAKVYSRKTGLDRAADNHYPTMTFDELAALELPAAKDCVLYLWTPVAQLANAMRLLEGWGFDYRSAHVWKKPDLGLGFWVRENTELLLVAVRGIVPAPAPGQQLPGAIEAPRERHSEKPEDIAELIERLWPTTPKLEMFARRARPGWDCWGNEVPDQAG
jgi:N6-adenosine-specific RNA methylase IME4